MAVTLHSPDVQALADKVSALNQEIDNFYKTHGNSVKVIGRCNYRTDGDDPYFQVSIEVSQMLAELS